MSTTLKISNINKLLEENLDIINITSNPTSQYLLYLIRSRPGITLSEIKEEFSFKEKKAEDRINNLMKSELIETLDNGYCLTQVGQIRLSLTDFSLEQFGNTNIPGDEEIENKLPDSYKLDTAPLGKGATSITFRAIQKSTGVPRTVKIYRPGIISYEKLEDFKIKRANMSSDVSIPGFIGMGQFKAKLEGYPTPVVLSCQVFEYIDDKAKTLHDFVNGDPSPDLSRDFFRLFVEHVGGALYAIEKAGLHHGDLHASNILVIQRKKRKPAISFKVIDFAGQSSFDSLSFSNADDLEMFKRHLIWCISEICPRHPGISARELIGHQVERIVNGLRENRYKNFSEMLEDFNRPELKIPNNYFKKPSKRPFEWLRVEMLPSIKDLYLLFQPDDYIFEAISGADNVIISGPRGCGKSHYLRILNFYPEIIKLSEDDNILKSKLKKLGYDYKRFFGILFECRVGEFKNYNPLAVDEEKFSAEIIRILKHIIILKIINKTLSVLRESYETCILIPPQDIPNLRKFIIERFPNILVYGEPNARDEMIQYSRALVTKEKQVEANWNQKNIKRNILLSEPDLDQFFKSLQRDLPNMDKSQFFILVDDASEGRMDHEMQKILNSIMTSSTKRYCFKMTCDRNMYTLDTAEGRSIDPYQDLVYADLGNLSIKAQKAKKTIGRYVRDIVNARLNTEGNKKLDIAEILGKSQQAKVFLKYLSMPRKITKKSNYHGSKEKGKPLYAGWNILWQLSHGSIRTLFQLLSFIFIQSKFDYDNPNTISLEEQDIHVRQFSKQKFHSLLMIKGEIDGEPLGTPLSDVARSIGEVSRLYLRNYDTGEKDRFYETISIERNDLKDLSKKTLQVLKYLIVYDVFITEGMNFSRAHVGLSQRYDLNKIYSPCFQITYRVRNHLYLNKYKFEQLLLNPEEFIKITRSKLPSLTMPNSQIQKTLFDEDI